MSSTISNFPPIFTGFHEYMNNTSGDHAGGAYRVFQFIAAFENGGVLTPLCRMANTTTDTLDGLGFFSANFELFYKQTAFAPAGQNETLANRVHRLAKNLTFACYYMVNLCALSLLLQEAKLINLGAIGKAMGQACSNGFAMATPTVSALLSHVISQDKIAELAKLSQHVAPTLQELVTNLVKPLRAFFIAAMVAEAISTLFEYQKCSKEIEGWNERLNAPSVAADEKAAETVAEQANLDDLEAAITAVTETARTEGGDPLKARRALEAAHRAFRDATKEGKTEDEALLIAKTAAKATVEVSEDVSSDFPNTRTFTKLQAQDHIHDLQAKRWVLVANLVKNMVSISNQLFLLTATASCPQLAVAIKFATPLTYMAKGVLESEPMNKWIKKRYETSSRVA